MERHILDFERAIDARDPDAFEAALLALSWGSKSSEACALLIRSLPLNWHFKHEDVAFAIQRFRCAGAESVLEARAMDCPEYLDWDDNYALARKCTWALADIGSAEARVALGRLAKCETEEISEFAQKRLDSWASELSRKVGS
ncbi:hypothetical protein EBB79_01250 [Parasedimentitalea marina]|uniref:HEAT repeat domain-containing protein n=1 Tax=Parasedimentitalea marina TaxID=2483033 RepID=A0A3T0MY11_9RHOB|nr:hypothetical protein [Parasedimentitalea marina]AZV76655.1 hypothetical protein EBB79_01250 [Parasedimentitalea marina]